MRLISKISFTILTLFTFSLLSLPSFSSEDQFQEWLTHFRSQAAKEGISKQVLSESLHNLKRNSKVLSNYRNQPEFEVTFEEYKSWFVNRKTIHRGRQLSKKYANLLEELYVRYGVQPRYLVAIWGIESKYGRQGEQFRVIPALATLAEATERGDYFEEELLNVLHIVQKHDLNPQELKGSWAGALGQPQFMPSSYREYAVDFDKDGFADIWSSEADVLASIANYLNEHGWNPSKSWGKAILSRNPSTEPGEKIIYDDKQGVGSYLVNGNFKVLKRYNPSNHYALTVGLLGDKIGPPPISHIP